MSLTSVSYSYFSSNLELDIQSCMFSTMKFAWQSDADIRVVVFFAVAHFASLFSSNLDILLWVLSTMKFVWYLIQTFQWLCFLLLFILFFPDILSGP